MKFPEQHVFQKRLSFRLVRWCVVAVAAVVAAYGVGSVAGGAAAPQERVQVTSGSGGNY